MFLFYDRHKQKYHLSIGIIKTIYFIVVWKEWQSGGKIYVLLIYTSFSYYEAIRFVVKLKHNNIMEFERWGRLFL